MQPVPVPLPLDTTAELLKRLGEVFGGISTDEARLVATGLVVVSALFVAGWLVPRLIDGITAAMGRAYARFASERHRRAVDGLPWVLAARGLGRVVQVAALVPAVAALLVVWERWSLAVVTLDAVERSLPLLWQVATTLVLVVVAAVGARLLGERVDRMSERSNWVGKHEEGLLLRASQVCLFALVGMVTLAVWEVNLGGLLVGAGFLGLVVGLAARQALASLVAGFVLMLSRPFEIGDWVCIGDEEGFVSDVTIINTHLRNLDGEFVVIPNEQVGNSVVTNRTREGTLRLSVEVGVDYGADSERAERVAREALEGVETVVDNPAPQVVPTGFGDSAVTLETRFWIDNPVPQEKWGAIREVVHAVKTAFEREGIEIPYPQRTLSGREDGGGFRVVGAGDERAERGRPTPNDD